MLPDTFTTAEIESRFGPLPKPVLDVRDLGAMYVSRFPRGEGYISHGTQTGAGELMILNVMPDDELFTKEGIGSFNITGLRRYIAAHKRTLKPQKIAISLNMIEALSSAGFDPHVIETMTIQRRNEPVIFFGSSGGRRTAVISSRAISSMPTPWPRIGWSSTKMPRGYGRRPIGQPRSCRT
jgi:hypothetical protein